MNSVVSAWQIYFLEILDVRISLQIREREWDQNMHNLIIHAGEAAAVKRLYKIQMSYSKHIITSLLLGATITHISQHQWVCSSEMLKEFLAFITDLSSGARGWPSPARASLWSQFDTYSELFSSAHPDITQLGATTQIWVTPESASRNKCGVSGFLYKAA